jgi:hypothetical protein
MPRVLRLVCGLLLIANLAVACSTHRRVASDTVQYEDRYTGEPVVVERHTTATESSTSDDTGVISGTFNVLGEIIALPFRVVGGLVRAIF